MINGPPLASSAATDAPPWAPWACAVWRGRPGSMTFVCAAWATTSTGSVRYGRSGVGCGEGGRAVKTYESSVDASGLRVAVVVSRFNHLISAQLLEGCERELVRRKDAN